jgi:ABC-type transporter MlaC component
MAKLNKYTGNATIQIKKDGRVIVKTETEYQSLEEAGIFLTNTEVVSALNKPIVYDFQNGKRKFA